MTEEPGPAGARLTELGRAAEGAGVSLVVGHGRDPSSEVALRVAADLAHRLQAHLHVVHGVDLDDYPPDPDAADWEEQARRALVAQREQVAQALAGSSVGWTYHAARGDPVDLLNTVAEEQDALMLVVGSRGEGFGTALEHLLSGSVSRGILRHQHRPVLVVPSEVER